MITEAQDKSRPWLSIAIAMYNVEKFLDDCLTSIRRQSFQDYEVILVDDGSSDATLEIAKKYAHKDARIKLFHSHHQGALRAKLHAADQVRGKYVLFCDSDDYYVKNAFQTLYRLAKDDKYELVQFSNYNKYNHVVIKEKMPYKCAYSDEKDFKYKEYPGLLCSVFNKLNGNAAYKLYHSRLLRNLPKEEERADLFMGDDVVMNLYMLQDCRSALYIDTPLYVYRTTSGNSNKLRKSILADLDKLKSTQHFFLSKWDGADKMHIEALLYFTLAQDFFSNVQGFVSNLSEHETLQLLNEALTYPFFISASKYFQKHTEDKRLVVELIRRYDAKAYIDAAKASIRSSNMLRKIRTWLVSIIKKI